MIDFSLMTKDERSLMLHALGWTIDKLNTDKGKDWAKNSKENFELSIEKYRKLHNIVANTKPTE